MADQQSVDEIVATGEAPSGSPTLVAAPRSPPASTHTSVKHREDEEHEGHKEYVDHVNGRPATPTSETIATDIEELQSPVPSTNFSEAPTLLTRDSNYTANTSGRARQSWRGGIVNFWRPESTSLLSNSTPTSESSGTNEERAASTSTELPQIEAHPIELPAAPVSRPDEPCSFFDSDSESEGETIIRTASRASSLRGQRPKLVEHHSSNGSLRQTRFYESALLAPPRNPGPSHSKAEQILGIKLKNLLDLTPAGEKSDPMLSVSGTVAALNALTANEVEKASTTALAPSTPSPPSSFDSSLVIEVPNTPSRAEALDTLPSPLGGFGTLRLGRPDSSRLSISPLDALRSNPITRLDTIGLHRATSAPPLPHRRNRKVTIRPVNMEIIHTANQKKLFRDSVVSTPYPTRHHSIAIADPRTPISPSKTTNTLLPTKEKDSSPSLIVSQISPPEILILELSLAKHPFATKMFTIPIYDRSTFDDRALFSLVRHTYNHTLLGFPIRFLTARTLSNATFIFPSSPSSALNPSETIPFDAASFLKHLAHPKSGHKRKTWLQWLRKHQPRLTSNNNNNTSSSRRNRSGSNASDPYFSADGIPRTPAFVDPRAPPPRPPLSNPSSPSSSPSSTSTSSRVPAVPRVELHHSFSLPRIASAVCLVLTLTVLAIVFWVLFGTQGVGVQDGDAGKMIGGMQAGDWRASAPKRVLTACVLGVLVFLMGSAGVVGWVGGSWAVL